MSKLREEAKELAKELSQFCKFHDSYHESLAVTSIESALIARTRACAEIAEKYVHVCNQSDDYIPPDTELEIGKSISEAILRSAGIEG